MKVETVAVKAINIKAGDKVRHKYDFGFVTVADAEQLPDGSVTVAVKHLPDGGMSWRYWKDPQEVVEVQREDADV